MFRMSPILLIFLPLFAQDPPPQEPPATLQETISVTAELAPTKRKDTTTHVTVIDAHRIEKQLAFNVSDLLRYEPGITVQKDSSRLGVTGISIRGIGGNRVSTQIDGIKIAEQYAFGPLTIPRHFLDPDLLKSAEIVRGAASSLYGSDALGGVIAFRTKDPADLVHYGKDVYLSSKLSYASDQEGGHLGLTYASVATSFDWMVHMSNRSFAETDNQGTNASLDATRTKPNDLSTRTLNALFKGVWHITDHHQLRISGEAYRAQTDADLLNARGNSSQFGVITTMHSSTAEDQNDRFRLSFEDEYLELGAALADSLTLQLYTQQGDAQQDTRERLDTTTPAHAQRIVRTGSMEFHEDQLGLGLRLKKWFTVGSSLNRIDYGFQFERRDFSQLRDRHDLDLDTGNPDAYTGSIIYPSRYFPDSTINEWGLYAQWEMLLFAERLKILPGLRYDRTELNPDANDTIFQESTGNTIPVDLVDDAVSPKLGLRFAFNEHLSLSAQVAAGFRAPPFSDVNSGFTNLASGYQTLPNPDLKPETSMNHEISLRAYNHRGFLALTFFDNHFEDFIDLPFIGVSDQGVALFQSRNIDEVKISGWELSGDLRWDEAFWLRMAYASIQGENTTAEVPLDSIAPDQASLGLHFARARRWETALTTTWNAAKSASALSNQSFFRTEASFIFDATLELNLNKSWRFGAGAFNLTDRTHYAWSAVSARSANDPTITRYSEPGRNFRANLAWTF